MKMNYYKNVFNRIKPNENLENEIISKAACLNESKQVYKPKRKFATVIAVAAAICIGTVGVSAAVNYEWIKSFFGDDFVISEDIQSLVAQTSNYECYSNCGIKMSLDGVVADEQAIYCQFNIDEMPEGYNLEELQMSNIASKSFRFNDEIQGIGATGTNYLNEDGKYIVIQSWDKAYIKENDSIAIHIYNCEQLKNYSDGREILSMYDAADISEEELESLYYEQELLKAQAEAQVAEGMHVYDAMTPESIENSNYDNILIHFDIEFSDNKIPSVKISEDKVQHNGLYSNLINNIEITPFKIICDVSATDYIDVKGKIILETGEEIDLETGSFSFEAPADENGNIHIQSNQDWTFSKPINPEDVAEIYIRNECIYTKE